MRRLLLTLMGAIAVGAGVFLVAIDAPGEECTLTLKRIASPTSRGYSPADYQLRATYPQSLSTQFQDASVAGRVRVQIGGQEDQEAAFKRLVKKEPAKYACKHPFRGVVKLGGQDFAFVFDAVGAKSDEDEAKEKAEKAKEAKEAKEKEKSKPKSSLLESLSRAMTGEESLTAPVRRPGKAIVYNRFYFDRNHNGDLTDDKVIEAESPGEGVYFSQNYARAQFPVVTVPHEAGGMKYEYAFTVNVSYQAIDYRWAYAWASFNAAAYREGEITFEGKKRRVVVIDFNSNGRFDDAMKLRDVRGRDREVYPEYGDVLLLDPDANLPVYLNPYELSSSENRYNISKLVSIEGKFYDLAISEAGDKLSLKPATPSLGYVTNPNDGFTAVVYGDKGFMKIRGGKSNPVPLPEGSWRLLSYTIDRTDMGEPEKPAAGAPGKEGEKQRSLLESMFRAVVGGAAVSSPIRPLRLTRVTAQATRDCKPVQVRKGETVVLPFGPPYKPVVRVDYAPGPGLVRLGMTLVGSVGERCTDMMIQGSRPSKPEFTISNPKGEVVYRGTFDYG